MEFFSVLSYRNKDNDVPVYFGRTEVIIVRWQMVFTGLVFVSPALYNSLDNSTKGVVDSYEFNVIFEN